MEEFRMAAIQTISFPKSVKQLGTQIISVLNAYEAGEVEDNEIIEIMAKWSRNVPRLFYAPESKEVNPALSKIIGKKRVGQILAMLETEN